MPIGGDHWNEWSHNSGTLGQTGFREAHGEVVSDATPLPGEVRSEELGPSEPVHITLRATLQAAGGLAAAAVLGGGLDGAAAAPLAGSPR